MDLERSKADRDKLSRLRDDLENNLDEILSSRSGAESKTDALKKLEILVGNACIVSATQTSQATDLGELIWLQDSFEYNIPCRLLPWISASTTRLELLASSRKTGNDDEGFIASKELVGQILLSLSVIQGVGLNHARSKKWLGRTKSLEVLVDLLLASRHVSSTGIDPSTVSQDGTPPSLTSTVLDTILCILVDSSPALRAFEECNGVQAVVKILKRAGTPREVRMKCLEFLYFYLLDETKPSASTASEPLSVSTLFDVPTVPNTPIRPSIRSRSHTRSNSSHSVPLPPTVPNTPAQPKQNSHSILRGASNSSIASTASTSSAGSNSLPSIASQAKAKKPYLNGLAAPARPSPKPRSEYGSSTFSFPSSSYSGPSVPSEGGSDKGYITESSPSSRSNSNNGKPSIDVTEGDGRTTKSLRSVSSGSAQSFTSTSSVASGISSLSTGSSTTAPSSTESSPKKISGALPLLPTIPSGIIYKTPPGSPEIEFVAPAFTSTTRRGRDPSEPRTPSAPRARTALHPQKTPSGPPKVFHLTREPESDRKQALSSNPQLRSLMMLKKDVDFVPESPQKAQLFGKLDGGSAASSPVFVSTGTVAGMGGRRTRTHSRTRSALALGASSSNTTTRTTSRTSSRERGHVRARSVGRRETEPSELTMQSGIGVLDGHRHLVGLGEEDIALNYGRLVPKGIEELSVVGKRAEIQARTTEQKKELLGTMLGNVDALVEGVRKAGIWGLG